MQRGHNTFEVDARRRLELQPETIRKVRRQRHPRTLASRRRAAHKSLELLEIDPADRLGKACLTAVPSVSQASLVAGTRRFPPPSRLDEPMSNWDLSALGYQRSFARLCAGAIPFILDGITDAPGIRLLDAGCGTGELSAAAALAGYSVLGVDSSPQMVKLARASHPGIRFAHADLTALKNLTAPGDLTALDDASACFDSVASNFVINHTADPRAAMSELYRVLTPGGIAAVTIWPYRVSELGTVWSEVLARSGAVKSPVERLPPHLDFERTCSGMRDLMRRADFTDVRSDEIEVHLSLSPDDLWAGAEAGIAVIGAAYANADAAMRERMWRVFSDIVEPATSGGLLHFTATAILAVGRR